MFPGKGYAARVLFVRAFGVWGTGSAPTRRGGFLEAPLTQILHVAFQTTHPSRTLCGELLIRCGVSSIGGSKNRESLRDPRSLCGGFRPRALDTVNLRMIVRVHFRRASADLAHSAALFVGGPWTL